MLAQPTSSQSRWAGCTCLSGRVERRRFADRQHDYYMVLHALGEHSKLRIAVIITATVTVQLGDENAGDMVLFIRLIHEVLANLLPDGGIEDFLFDRGMDLEFGQRFGDDLFLRRRRFRLFESF